MRHAARYLCGFVMGLLVCLVIVLFLSGCGGSSGPALSPVEVLAVVDDVGQASRPCVDSAHDVALVACRRAATEVERDACSELAERAHTVTARVLEEVHRVRCQVDPGGCQ